MSPTVTDTDVLQVIREELATLRVPDAEKAEPATSWKDLDVDSLDLVELVKSLEDRFEVSIADGRLKEIATVGDTIKLVQELQTA